MDTNRIWKERRLFASAMLLLVASLLALPLAAAAQDGAITGAVVDQETGESLPGASVQLLGENIGTATDADGRYTIGSVDPGEYTVRASFIGYETQDRSVTVSPADTAVVDFSLAVTAAELSEVVVTGYGGTTQRRNLTTSIASISGEELAEVTTFNAAEALQGRAAGAQVTSASGMPGGGIQVRIRGISSINGSNQPLYVVDGVPVASQDFTNNTFSGQNYSSALAQLDLSNVASIEVLKGPAATAIYGTRAANGVVLITTKRGQAGPTQVSFKYSAGTTWFGNELGLLTGPEYIRIRNEGVRNQGLDQLPDPIFNNAFPGTKEFPYGNPEGQPTSRVFEAIQQDGFTQDAQLTFSGGDERTRYLLSGSFTDETGTIIESGFQRLGGTINVDQTFADGRAKLSGQVRYSRAVRDKIDNNQSIFGLLTNALLAPRNVPVRDSTGKLNPGAGAFSNPVSAARIENTVVDTKFLGNIELGYDLLPSLKARVSAGLDRFDAEDNLEAPSTTTLGAPGGLSAQDRYRYANYILNATLDYRQDLGSGHNLDVVAGGSVQETNISRVEATASGFPSDDLLGDVSAGATPGAGSFATSSGLISTFAKADYNYDDRYLLTLTARLDGSSRFGEDNRYGFFPAAAAAYNIAEEPFAEDAPWLDQFKLRGSVGLSGQQNIDDFVALGVYEGGAAYAGRAGLEPTRLANPSLQYEKTLTTELGLDFSFFEGRLGGTVAAYQRNTSELLLERPLPGTSGFTDFTENVGQIRNRGLEFSLSTVNVDAGSFRWTSSLNVTTNQNEVTDLAGATAFPADAAGRARVSEGEPIGVFYGYVADGLFRTEDELASHAMQPGAAVGDIRFKDLNGDGVINAQDRKVIGNPHPDAYGGLTNDVRLGGLELSFLFQFSLGNDMFNVTKTFIGIPGSPTGTLASLNDRFTPENTDASVPRATLTDPNNNARNSTYFVEDGSYLRLKNLRLAYHLPIDLLGNFGVGAAEARLFVVGKNLLTFTDYSGLDPEVNFGGTSNTIYGQDYFNYPQYPSVQAGVRLGF